MVSEPVVTALATAEPEIIPKSPDDTTQTLAGPPEKRPATIVAQVHEQAAEPRHLRQDAEEHEVEDVGGDDAHRDPVDTLGADVDVVDHANDRIAAVREDARHVAAEQRVEQARHPDQRQERSHRPARGLHHHDDREHAHHVVLRDRRADALDEHVVEEGQEVQRRGGRRQRERPIGPRRAVGVPPNCGNGNETNASAEMATRKGQPFAISPVAVSRSTRSQARYT